MPLSREEIDGYIQMYYSSVVDDPQDRSKLIEKAQSIVRWNIHAFGSPNSIRLHETLEDILDNHRAERNISLGDDLTGEGIAGEGFTPEHFVQSSIVLNDHSDRDKGRKLVETIQQ